MHTTLRPIDCIEGRHFSIWTRESIFKLLVPDLPCNGIFIVDPLCSQMSLPLEMCHVATDATALST